VEFKIVALDMKDSELVFHALLIEIFEDQEWLQRVLNNGANVQPVNDQRNDMAPMSFVEDDPEKTIVAELDMPKSTSLLASDNLKIMPSHLSEEKQPEFTGLEATIFIPSCHVSGKLSEDEENNNSNTRVPE